MHKDLKPGYVGKLRSGQEYRCYAIDAGGVYPVHGAYRHEKIWKSISHTGEGIFQIEDKTDLDIDLPEAPKIDWSNICPWLNYAAMDEDKSWFLFSEKPGRKKAFMSKFSTCRIPKAFEPKFTGDWKDSLISRND